MVRRSRNGRAFLLALGCAAAVAACNAIAGLGEDFALDPNAGDGSIGTGEGGGPDGQGTDAPADGLVQGDAKADSPVGDGGLFCSSVTDATFCDDFEKGGRGANFDWSGMAKGPTAADASIELTTVGVGGTRGLRVSVYETTPGFMVGDFAHLNLVIGGPNPRLNAVVEVEFEFRVLSRAPVDYLALGIVAFPNQASGGEHGVAAYDTGQVSITGTRSAAAISGETQWHHALIRLEREAGGLTAKRFVTIDTIVQDDSPNHPLPNSGGTFLRLGTMNPGANVGAMTAAFDNVVIRRQ